jgi:hypothetical protein
MEENINWEPVACEVVVSNGGERRVYPIYDIGKIPEIAAYTDSLTYLSTESILRVKLYKKNCPAKSSGAHIQ